MSLHARSAFVVVVAMVAMAFGGKAYAHLPEGAFCSVRQPAKVELACARHAFWHSTGTVEWIRQHVRRTLASSDPQVAARFNRMLRDHLWLAGESKRWLREARDRLRPTLDSWGVPRSFVAAALCTHDGYLHADAPPYRIIGDVSGSGEGSWAAVGVYGGGLQFLVGTWNRAAGMSGGRVPYVSSTWQISTQPPLVQIYAMFLVVRGDGGRFGEWPTTARACGLPT